MREQYPKIQMNALRAYCGKPFVIDLEGKAGSITVNIPTMGAAFLDSDENNFWSTIQIFTANTTSFRLFLHNLGLDWNEITDFQLFRILYKEVDPEICKLLFGEKINLRDFEVVLKQSNTDETLEPTVTLYNRDIDTEIDEEVYQYIHQLLCSVLHMWPEEELTNDKLLKKWWIEKDQRKVEREQKEEHKPFSIQPLISACVNHPGFKYKLSEIENMSVAEFYDSVTRLQIYESSTALMKGMYSGMISSKDIKPEEYNWMKDFNK